MSGGKGGGVFYGEAIGCLIKGNSAAYGGAAYDVALRNCTIVDNAFTQRGSAAYGSVHNCIVVDNDGPGDGGVSDTSPTYSCLDPFVSGTGNVAAPAGFVDAANGNYRLLTNSPCINAGEARDWMNDAVDLDGDSRVQGNGVDMGAYEREVQ